MESISLFIIIIKLSYTKFFVLRSLQLSTKTTPNGAPKNDRQKLGFIFRPGVKKRREFLTPPKTEHQRIDLSAMRLALACSVMMRCAYFTHECPLRTLHMHFSSRWLSPPETTSEYRTYAHKTHAHTHATLSKKYGASRTTFRGRTATHHWPVTVVLLLTEVPRHRCFSDRRS